MDAFEVSELLRKQDLSTPSYNEFFRKDDLSIGIYALPAGAEDRQQPHDEDEAYYVINGQATVLVGEEEREIAAGSVVFVAKHVEHRFHSITQDLALLVFFAPAESA